MARVGGVLHASVEETYESPERPGGARVSANHAGVRPRAPEYSAVGIPTLEPKLPLTPPGQLGNEKGRELAKRQPPGQGLGHLTHQLRRDRAEKEEPPLATAQSIDRAPPGSGGVIRPSP